MGVLEQAAQRQAKGQAFALATVVRTVSVTAAKAGAKALIGADGSIVEGWIGGGCARAAVVKAARQCMADGRSRLVSIAPKDALADLGAAAGEERGGVFYAKNSCPSQGTMDVFVEPVLPSPRLLILGASPVAVALARLAPSMGFAVAVAAAPEEHERFGPEVERLVGVAAPPEAGEGAFVVVSTQGSGDRAALKSVSRDACALPRFRRLAPQGRDAQARTRRGRRPERGARRDQGARRARHLRHLVGRDRAFDPGRNDRGAPQA